MRCLVQNLTASYQLYFPLDKACILPVASLSYHQRRRRTAPSANTEIQQRIEESCVLMLLWSTPLLVPLWCSMVAGLSTVNIGANDFKAGILFSYPFENCHQRCSEVRKLLIHLRNCQQVCKEMSDGGFGNVLGQETPAVWAWFLIWTNRETKRTLGRVQLKIWVYQRQERRFREKFLDIPYLWHIWNIAKSSVPQLSRVSTCGL